MKDYAGPFEVHLTVRLRDFDQESHFANWCSRRSLKFVSIVLSRGQFCQQPMATWKVSRSILCDVLNRSEQVAVEARQAEFDPVRLKIEVSPANDDVPASDSDAELHSRHNYFEHHVKLQRQTGCSTGKLNHICELTGAHLSRNALRQVANGFEERFVTLRTYRCGRTSSEQALAQLIGLLTKAGEHILEIESEYCVYDSNVQLDAGWLRTGSSSSSIL